VPGTQQEFDAFNAAIRLRPGNTTAGITAEQQRIAAGLRFLGRPLNQNELSVLSRRLSAGGSREDRRHEAGQLKDDLERIRQRIAGEVRSAYAFINDSFPANGGGSNAGPGVGGSVSPSNGARGYGGQSTTANGGSGAFGFSQASGSGGSGGSGPGGPAIALAVGLGIAAWFWIKRR